MFDTSWIADLDADSACHAITATQLDLREQELRELLLAAHWATLHGADSLPARPGPVLPGTERARRLGGHGRRNGCAASRYPRGLSGAAARAPIADGWMAVRRAQLAESARLRRLRAPPSNIALAMTCRSWAFARSSI